jgi:hypothetical protein
MICQRQDVKIVYQTGEAYLAGPRHTPHDSNANFMCKEHQDGTAVIA